jgi:hypothetical protein
LSKPWPPQRRPHGWPAVWAVVHEIRAPQILVRLLLLLLLLLLLIVYGFD